MSPSPAKLVVRFGPHSSQEYPLPEHTVTLGREPINDIVVNDPEISRRHTRIVFENGAYRVEDLGSTNGTFVNGRRLSELTPIKDGDILDLGESASFTFVGGPAQQGGFDATMMESGNATQIQSPSFSPGSHAMPPRPAPAPYAPEPYPAYGATERITEPPQPMPYYQAGPPPMAPAPAPRRSNARLFAGCGCLLLLTVVLCAAAFFILDSYDNGSLLYCGPLRPIWESVMGAGNILQTCGPA
jgi:hypothetical protein